MCDECGRNGSAFGFVRFGSVEEARDLCNRCFNEEAARRLGLEAEFQYEDFAPVELEDARGEFHEFHFRTHLYGSGVLLEAAELSDGVRSGYAFAVTGAPGDDPFALHGRLLAKMRRGLSRTHIVKGEHGKQIGSEDVVRGRIEYDVDEEGRLPVLIVDGRRLSWEELGTLLVPYEGFDFELAIVDPS